MPAASSRNVKRRTRKRRPALQQAILPGYCSFNNWRKFIDFVVTRQLQEGIEVTMRMLKDEAGIPEGEVYLVRAAARHLKFLDAQNRITEALVQLIQANDDEYRKILTDAIELTYHDELLHIADLAHANQQELKAAFNRNGTYEPTTLQKIVGFFKALIQEAGMVVNEIEMPDADTPNEQVSEVSSLTGKETTTYNSLEVKEGTPLMVEHPSNPQMNGSLPTSDYSEAEEIGKFLMSLFELPKKPGWTEEDRAWWRLAVSSKAEKIAQLTKEHGGMKP